MRGWVSLAGLLWLAAGAHAQFNGMATTDDGGTLYVVTPLRLAGTTETAGDRIFVGDAGGFRLYADQFPGPNAAGALLSKPWVSGDGSTVAYNGHFIGSPPCAPFGGPCNPPYTETAIRTADGGTRILNGPAILSANARFALMPAALGTNTGSEAIVAQPVLVDLTTGGQTPIPLPAPGTFGYGVASDGTVLLANVSTLYLWRANGGLTSIPAANTGAVMSDGASTIVYTSGITIYLYDVTSGGSRIFANGSAPSMSRDGSWVAFVSPVNGVPQAWAVATNGSQFVQLTSEPMGVTAAVVSGGGGFVYVTTAANGILKFDLAGGSSTLVVPPTPAAVCVDGCVGTPGSLLTVPARGLTAETVAAAIPLPVTLAGYQVWLNDTAVPLVSISPTAVVVQVPWEMPVAAPGVVSSIRVKGPEANPVFEAMPGVIRISGFFPWFVNASCTGPGGIPDACAAATHADGSSVSTDSPAHANEVITLQMIGLGAVSPPVPTGEAAPADPPAVVQHALVCVLLGYAGAAPPVLLGAVPILRSQLMPGAVGTYQVTAQLPAQTGNGPVAQVSCAGADYSVAGLVPVTAGLLPAIEGRGHFVALQPDHADVPARR